MGKCLRGKKFGIGISKKEDDWYVGRYTNKCGKCVRKLFQKLQECGMWLADA